MIKDIATILLLYLAMRAGSRLLERRLTGHNASAISHLAAAVVFIIAYFTAPYLDPLFWGILLLATAGLAHYQIMQGLREFADAPFNVHVYLSLIHISEPTRPY